MKTCLRILGLFALLLTPGVCFATTYYVDNCVVVGSDSNNGTSTATPWLTIAKVNASTFSAGDSVLFERTCIWYGTALVIPSSGSSGSVLTFGGYGTGADPLFKGATNLNVSGFALAPNIFTTVYQHNDSGTHEGHTAQPINFRLEIPAANPGSGVGFSNSGTFLSFSVKAAPTGSLQISGMAIGPAANGVGSGAYPAATSLTPITWSGSATVTIPAGTTAASDYINYALNNSVAQLVTMYSPSPYLEFFVNNGDALWELSNGGNQSQALNPGGFSFSGGLVTVASVVNQNITAYTYYGALGSTPVAMWENDTLLKLANNPLGVDQTAGSWFYDGTYVYIHASDGSNVPTNGYAYDYVTSASPTYNIWDNGKTYVTVDGIDTSEVYCTSTALFACLADIIVTGTHNIFENLSSHDAWRHNFCFYTGAANNTASNLTLFNSYGDSPVCVFGSGTTNNLLQTSLIYNDTYLREANVVTGDVWSLVIFHGGSTSNTMDSCVLYSTAGPYRSNTFQSHGYGILVGDSGTTATVSHNLLYGNFEWGLYLGQNGNFGEGPGGQVVLWDNLIDCSACYLSASGGAAYYAYGAASGSLIYDNTIYAPSAAAPVIQLQSTTTGTLIKNNVVYAGNYVLVDAGSETSTALDYNNYFGASGTPFSWGGTAYNFANWKTNSSQDAHAIVTDPQLINAPARIYTLTSGSPAITAGVSLGSTYQSSLLPASSWPSGVQLQNRTSTWEIGAYLFVGGSAPPGGVADQVTPIAVGP